MGICVLLMVLSYLLQRVKVVLVIDNSNQH